MTQSLEEVEEILAILKTAYKNAAESGGVSQYSLNSGQGATNIKQATLAEIRVEIEKYQNLYDELSNAQSGGNIICVRGGGF